MGGAFSLSKSEYSSRSDWFRKTLESCRIPSALDTTPFVPISDIRRLVQRPIAIEILAESKYSLNLNDELVTTIVHAAPAFFALLVWIGQPHLALTLGPQYLNDENLPLNKSTLENFGITTTFGWGKNQEAKILQEQWMFLSPVWHREGHVLLDTPSSAPLPFVFVSPVIKDLVNSTVRKTQIHPAHLPFGIENNNKVPNLALKLFKPRAKKRFEHELYVLQALNRKSHPHVVKLVMAISSPDRRILVFPWAQCDLSELMQWEVPSDQRKKLDHWVFEQFVGLLSGLATIHCPPSSDGRSYLQARHGDLQPANLLLMGDLFTDSCQIDKILGCKLQIASMAMTDLFKDESQYTIPSETGTYQGPECNLQQTIGPLYDVWTLGCVFLEMIVWLAEGQAGLMRFASDRTAPDPLFGDRLKDDCFFTLKAKDGSYIGAEVKHSVLNWLERMSHDERLGACLISALEVMKADMLVPDSSQRLGPHDLAEKLKDVH